MYNGLIGTWAFVKLKCSFVNQMYAVLATLGLEEPKVTSWSLKAIASFPFSTYSSYIGPPQMALSLTKLEKIEQVLLALTLPVVHGDNQIFLFSIIFVQTNWPYKAKDPITEFTSWALTQDFNWLSEPSWNAEKVLWQETYANASTSSDSPTSIRCFQRFNSVFRCDYSGNAL